jgi:hypothetical protein
MNKFLSNLFSFMLIGIIPLVIILITYFYFDPFQVLYKYNSYSNSHVQLDRDFVGTETFINNNKKSNFNSYIFGSSRTMAFGENSWKKHIPAGARPFLFDAASENIFGIWCKLKYLDRTNCKIDNALIIICRDQSFAYTGNQNGHLFLKDPIISSESKLVFQTTFFKSYLNPSFLFDYWYYKITKHYKSFMKEMFEIPIAPNVENNFLEKNVMILEETINRNPGEYYRERESEFYSRPKEGIDSIKRINPQIFNMLKEITEILKRHKTNYKVVLSPLYEQIKFSKEDMNILNSLFGNKLYDFSGKNSFTDSKYNYYEHSHYRAKVGDSIMDIIYKK